MTVLVVLTAAGMVHAADIASHPTLTQGMIAYYTFEGNFNDGVYGHFNGKMGMKQIQPEFLTGKIGKAYHGKKRGAVYIGSPDFSRKSFSVSFWVKSDEDFSHNRNIFALHGRGLKDNNMTIAWINKQFMAGFMWNDIHSKWPDPRQWRHFVYVQNYDRYDDKLNYRRVYLDGKLSNQDPMSGGVHWYEGEGKYYIDGTRANDADNFRGLIDELGLWYKPLTAEEIKVLYNEGNGLPLGKLRLGPSRVDFIFPQAGQQLISEDIAEIKWSTRGRMPLTDIQYSADGGKWKTIMQDAPGTGVFRWRVTALTSSRVRLRLVDRKSGKSFESPAFSVREVREIANVRVGTEHKPAAPGSRATIRWDYKGIFGKLKTYQVDCGRYLPVIPGRFELGQVKIQYSVNGTEWLNIEKLTENDGVYFWRLPADLKGSITVRVMSPDGKVSGVSSKMNIRLR